MEIPYAGRAIITDNFNELNITIPTKKNGFMLAFLGFWLCGWLFGEITAIGQLSHGFDTDGGLFMLVWLGGWTVGGIFTIRIFFWNLIGVEIITAGQGVITITKKGMLLFINPKTFDLNEVKKIRVQEEPNGFGSFNSFGSNARRNNIFSLDGGTIRFDYGMETIKFGGGLSEAEAQSIIVKLTDKKILSDKNF